MLLQCFHLLFYTSCVQAVVAMNHFSSGHQKRLGKTVFVSSPRTEIFRCTEDQKLSCRFNLMCFSSLHLFEDKRSLYYHCFNKLKIHMLYE